MSFKMYNNKTTVVLVSYHTNIVWQKILEYSTRLKSIGEIVYFQSTTRKKFANPNCYYLDLNASIKT
jgi:hypothetical protein